MICLEVKGTVGILIAVTNLFEEDVNSLCCVDWFIHVSFVGFEISCFVIAIAIDDMVK